MSPSFIILENRGSWDEEMSRSFIILQNQGSWDKGKSKQNVEVQKKHARNPWRGVWLTKEKDEAIPQQIIKYWMRSILG